MDAVHDRYDRQLSFEGWGAEGQERLAVSTVFVAGCGGLGSPVLLYLAAAGVGRLLLCDDGTLEGSNLNRQVLYGTADIGRPKAELALERLSALNPEIRITASTERIDERSISALARGADILVDCLDNYATRRVLNRFSVETGTPFVHAGVYGMAGQAAFISPPKTPCLACIIPDGMPEYETPPPVIGAAPGILGGIQAMEVLKYLTGIGDPLPGVLFWDGEAGTFETVRIERDPTCPVCGERRERAP